MLNIHSNFISMLLHVAMDFDTILHLQEAGFSTFRGFCTKASLFPEPSYWLMAITNEQNTCHVCILIDVKCFFHHYSYHWHVHSYLQYRPLTISNQDCKVHFHDFSVFNYWLNGLKDTFDFTTSVNIMKILAL